MGIVKGTHRRVSSYARVLMYCIQKLKQMPLRLVAYALALTWSTELFAAGAGGDQTLGDVGQQIGQSSGGMGFMLYATALVVGFGLVISGLITFAIHRRTREGVTNPLLLIGFGALLLAVPLVITVMQTTAFGQANSGTAFTQLQIPQ